MKRSERSRNNSGRIDLWMKVVPMVIAMLTITLGIPAPAQTLTVLHQFRGENDLGPDGASPVVGLTMDRRGNLYGATLQGGPENACRGASCGIVFQLQHKGSAYIYAPLYDFQGGSDGAEPEGRLAIGPDGSLYGTTIAGGQGTCNTEPVVGCGVVFNLRPPATFCKSFSCPWEETVIYRFSGSDGASPVGDLAFDQQGNLYGVAAGGNYTGNCVEGCGVVYKLTPSNGSWTESVIYAFTGGSDGAFPFGGVVFDAAGNLYGTTNGGGNLNCQPGEGSGCGTVFELSPAQSGWTLNTLYTFQGGNDGYSPHGGLAFYGSSNLYGATDHGGTGKGGTIFQLTKNGGNWTFSTIYGLTAPVYDAGPQGALAVDQAGTLYGASLNGGTYGIGYIFKLAPSNGSWLYTDLHDFVGEEGSLPYDGLVVDGTGNVYGTSFGDGEFGRGTVFEITP
jgi:hypothetical protein